jgi:peptidoglycan/xylan/chitin deacetylase (PgdA/CDA1 family)
LGAREPAELTAFETVHQRRRDYHIYQEYEKKRRRKIWLTTVVSIVVIASIGAFFWLNRSPELGLSIHSETLEGIDIESIIEWNDAHIAVHYPRTKNDAVNKILADFAETTVRDFKDEVDDYPNTYDELNMSFKTYRHNEDVVSFAFDQYIYHEWQAHGANVLATKTFNLETGKQHELNDILKGDYLDELSRRAFNELKTKAEFKDKSQQAALREGLAAKPDNFKAFVLDQDKITFLFGQYQLGPRDVAGQRVSIPLGDIKDFLKGPFRLAEDKKSPPKPESPPVTNPPPVDISGLAGKKLVALTFDDGPHPTNTKTLLDNLKQENAKATFFVLGTRVDYYGDIVRRAYQEGHEIASHTRNHKDLTKLSTADRQFEINSTISSIEKTIGARPTVMRPPYGAQNAAVKADAGMPLILWSIDPEDWKYRNANTVYNHVMSHVRDGSIILLHDIHATTIQAAARIVPALKAQGYTLVTVDQLIRARGGDLTPGKVYTSMYP